MNVQETAELLAKIQLIDNRQISDATVLEWWGLVDDLDIDVAVAAVDLFRRESTAYLVPAHVRQNVERILTAPEHPEDEWGNPLEPDRLAIAARERVQSGAGRRMLKALDR